MKRTVLILMGIALLTLLLAVRILFKQKRGATDERKWFVKALRYEFSAQVDSVWMFNPNAGRLRCLLTMGDPRIDQEDIVVEALLRTASSCSAAGRLPL